MVDIWIMSPTPVRQDWLLRVVRDDPDIHIAGTAATFPFLRSLISETSADLAIIDLQSYADSNAARGWVIELSDLVSVLLLCDDSDATTLNHLVRGKIGGVLRSDSSAEQITRGIKSVASGLTVFDAGLVRHAQRGIDDQAHMLESLTARESEVLGLLADGLGNKDIAGRLNVSEHTIKFHIRSILGKLGASSRTEAVSRGLRSGLIDL